MSLRTPPTLRTATGDGRPYDPSRALWTAVLEGWYADRWTLSAGITGARRQATDRDHDWLVSDAVHPGSFVWICQVLDVEPDYLRQGLLTPPANRLRRAIP